MHKLIPFQIERYIHLIRGHKVMLDEDLARIYGVSTKRLNQQVQRNGERFPQEFMFQLNREEAEALRLQNATLDNHGRGRYRKYLPYAFSEHGAIMLSAVLKTPTAVAASIEIAKVFVRIRELLATNKELARKLEELEKTYDAQFKVVFDAIRELMAKPVERLPRRIKGFRP
jgi:hypothetical protein